MHPHRQHNAPLLRRHPDEVIARISSPLPLLNGFSGRQTVSQFLGAVDALAEALPDRGSLINLCDNRYLFMLSFCAAIRRGQTNLLAQNRGLATQAALLAQHADAYVLHDGAGVVDGAQSLDLRELSLQPPPQTAIPQIPLDQLAAIAYTSGSTGGPQPNHKTWRTFTDSTAINGHYMLDQKQPLVNALATVPGQHMWGLETSILIPLMFPVCISDARPLMPLDISRALERLPAPRLLVSTPVHLRALTLSGVEFPATSRILCATAPLSPALAAESEKTLGGSLYEVYGCSEVGSMAIRRTVEEEEWSLFSGLHMLKDPETETCVISADHLPAPVPLQDRITCTANQRFRLLGRGDDMVEIAGKRGSLLEMNGMLLAAPGVRDGIFFMPPESGHTPVRRTAALVVFEPSGDAPQLMDYLRQRLDAAFLPRPLIAVDSLPRESNGKLPRSKLLDFYRTLRSSG